jgi:uncharacterized delta-60 repeat protein
MAFGAAMVAAVVGIAAPAAGSRHTSSRHDWAYALAIQQDGRLVAAGLTDRGARSGLALARYTTKGGLDRTFGNDGKLVATDVGNGSAVATETDGKILVGSRGGNGPRGGRPGTGTLARYLPRGTLDPSFGHGGRATGFGVNAIAIQKNGRIVAAGAGALARFTRAGLPDASFGRQGKVKGGFGALALQADGKIVVVANVGRTINRYTARGTLDSTFGRGGRVRSEMYFANALAIARDGKIVVAGEDEFSDFALARFTADGTLDPSFGNGGKVLTDFPIPPGQLQPKSQDVANAVAIQRDGKIIAAGRSDGGVWDEKDHSIYRFALVRYNDDGSLDTSFGRGGRVTTHYARQSSDQPSSSIAEAAVIQRNGKIAVAGLGNGYDFALARYTTNGHLDPTFDRDGKVLTDFSSG